MNNTFELTFSDLIFFYLVTFSGEIFFFKCHQCCQGNLVLKMAVDVNNKT